MLHKEQQGAVAETAFMSGIIFRQTGGFRKMK